MKGKIEAVILLPRHLLMSCSGLNILGDTFGCDVQLATEQIATGLNRKSVKEA